MPIDFSSLEYSDRPKMFPPQGPGVWDQVSDYAMQALGGAKDIAGDAVETGLGVLQGAGQVASGALSFAPGLVAGAALGPFVDGAPGPDGKMRSGAETIQDFVGELFYPPKPPDPNTPAGRGYATVTEPVNEIMDVVFGPGEDIQKMAEPYIGEDAAWGLKGSYDVLVAGLLHMGGKKVKGVRERRWEKKAQKIVKDIIDETKYKDAKQAEIQARIDEATKLANQYKPELSKTAGLLEADVKNPDIKGKKSFHDVALERMQRDMEMDKASKQLDAEITAKDQQQKALIAEQQRAVQEQLLQRQLTEQRGQVGEVPLLAEKEFVGTSPFKDIPKQVEQSGVV